jgi:hypothetical protein
LAGDHLPKLAGRNSVFDASVEGLLASFHRVAFSCDRRRIVCQETPWTILSLSAFGHLQGPTQGGPERTEDPIAHPQAPRGSDTASR